MRYFEMDIVVGVATLEGLRKYCLTLQSCIDSLICFAEEQGGVPSGFLEVVRRYHEAQLQLAFNDLDNNKPGVRGLPDEAILFKPVSPCVYFLTKGISVVYVGQSTCIESRIKQHEKDKEFNHVYVIPCKEENLLNTERYWIDKLQPTYNKV